MPLTLCKQFIKRIIILKQIVAKNSIYCEEEKEELMAKNPNCGLCAFSSETNSFGGINVILWQKVNIEEKSYPEILFTLEMKKFSFTVPVLADEEQGVFKMPKFSGNIDIVVYPLDFTKEEMEFTMSAKEVNIMDPTRFEDELRRKKLLRE